VHELELDGAGFRVLVDAVMERLMTHLDTLPAAPATWPPSPAPPSMPLPEAAGDIGPVLDELFGRMPAGINTASPGFMGYIPGGGIPHAAAADLIGGIINRYVGIAPPAPHLAAIERDVIRWFAAIVGLPATAAGTFTSGGSAANLIALAAAREDRFPSGGAMPADTRTGRIYISDQAHHSVMKGARMAGISAAQINVIETDATFRMRADLLRSAIAADRAAGFEPFLLVASGGTTNTGAVDPLLELADIAVAERMWFHVDAAYGGFFALTERGRHVLAGIERADSVVLDPHKTLFLPYGTGALLVREPERVARAFDLAAEYLPQREEPHVEAADMSFELTRPFRGLRVWLPLRLHGSGAFARALDEKLDLALRLERAVREIETLELIAPPQLSTLALATRPRPQESLAGVNARTLRLLEAVNADRCVLVTGTMLRGRFAVRPSIVSFRTHAAQIDDLIARLKSAAHG
jgi:aromatic-L-amino-acid/L-tryptophan decarboxylase